MPSGWPPWLGACSLCGRRRPGSGAAADSGARPENQPKLTAEERLLAAGFKPAAKRKSCDINYSKWENLDDSDDGGEGNRGASGAGAGVAAASEPEAPSEEPAAAALPSRDQRLQIVDGMLELCRKAQCEAKGLTAPGSGSQKASPVCSKLPAGYRESVNIISAAQLAKFSCSNDRMLVSCYGDIFDVSSRPDLYGNGKLSWHAGKDITWVVVTGDERPANCNRFYDIFKLDQDRLARYMQLICWKLVALEEDFGDPVGRLEPFMSEEELPAPPEADSEECKQQ